MAAFKLFNAEERKSYKADGVSSKKASALLDAVEAAIGATCGNSIKTLLRDILPKDLEKDLKSMGTNIVKPTVSSFGGDNDMDSTTIKGAADAAVEVMTTAMTRVHREVTPDLDQRLLHILKMARNANGWAFEEMQGQPTLAIDGADGSKQFFMLKPEELDAVKEHINKKK